MIEALYYKGKTGPTYPDSGPGPTTISKGNEDFGFFGTVPESVFNMTATVLNAANAASPAFVDRRRPDARQDWLKFMYRGKVMFVCPFPFATTQPTGMLRGRVMFDTEKKGTADFPTVQIFDETVPTTPLEVTSGATGTRFRVRALDGKDSTFRIAPGTGFNLNTEAYDLLVSVIMPGRTNAINVRYPEMFPIFETGGGASGSFHTAECSTEVGGSFPAISCNTSGTVGFGRARSNATGQFQPVLEVIPPTP